MQRAMISTDFAAYCKSHPRHPKRQLYENIIGEEVLMTDDPEFLATGNGGGEPWVRVLPSGAKEPLAIPKKFVILLDVKEGSAKKPRYAAAKVS